MALFWGSLQNSVPFKLNILNEDKRTSDTLHKFTSIWLRSYYPSYPEQTRIIIWAKQVLSEPSWKDAGKFGNFRDFPGKYGSDFY